MAVGHERLTWEKKTEKLGTRVSNAPFERKWLEPTCSFLQPRFFKPHQPMSYFLFSTSSHFQDQSKAAICEVGQVIARKFEAGSSQTGPVRQCEEVRGEGAEAVWSDTPSFPFTRRSDGRCTQSSGEDQFLPRSKHRHNQAVQKAEVIKSTQLYIGRTEKRVEQARQAVIVAREALDKAVAIQQEQEAMLADGVKRLTELQEKERSLPSPFAVPEPTVPASVQAEFNRLQSVIEGLQKELSAFRSGHAVHFSGVEDDDDDMVVDLRHKKSKVGPKTPLAITGAAPATPPFFNGDSHQFRSVSGVSST